MQMRNYNQQMQHFQNNQLNSNKKQDNRQVLLIKKQQFPKQQQPIQRSENPFVYELLKIMNSNDETNKREIIGEQIFYYLKNLLAVTKLNNLK